MVSILRLLSLLIFCGLTSAASLQVIKAQNFGSSSSYLSSNSITFSADSIGSSYYYSSISTSSAIAHTKDQALYQTGLWVALDSHYKFSVSLADGDYILILRFAEIQYDSAASRVFSMKFGDNYLFEYLDIYQLAGGKNIAVDFFYEFTVSRSVISLGSFSYDITQHKGMLDFEIISVIDKGIINALQIIQGSCEKTRICNNCYDSLCNTCNYTTAICQECVYNAQLNDKNYCACPSKAVDGSIIAILSGPSYACSGCMVKLDGTGSIGSGGLNYKWNVDGLTKSTDSIFYYTVPDVSSQTTTNVTLIVTDWCGFQNTSALWTISIMKDPVIVDIKEYDLSYDTSKYSSFSADSMMADNSSVRKYEWTASPPVKGLNNPNQKDITIQFPTSDAYSISLTVYTDSGKTGIDVATINVMPEVPVIVVTGVNSTYNNFTTVTFNATFLYQNGTNDQSYAIDYLIKSGCPDGATFRKVSNGAYIFKSYGAVASYYTCNFFVTAEIYPGKNASTLCYLNITATPVPLVYVTYTKQYFDWSAPIRFMANIPDQTDLVFEWEQTDNNTKIDTNLLTTPKNQSSYTIKERILEPQKEYEFTIHVRNTKTGATADVSTKRWVNSPPKFGTFTVTPSSGTILETPFTAVFQGFVDPEKNLPISYQVFQTQSNGNTVAITPKTSSNNFNITIGDNSGIVPLIGRVYDSLGTFAEYSFNLTVNPSTKSIGDQAQNLLNSGGNIDQTLYISSIVAITQYTFQNPTSGTSTESVVSTLLQALNNWSDSKEMTDIDVSTTFDVISVFLNESSSYGEELIQNISKSLDSALSKADTLDDSTYKVFIKQVDIVSGRSGQILSSGNSTNNNMTYADLWTKVTSSFSLSSEKYQKKNNPNEEPISIQGDNFNVTLESRDYRTVKNVNKWSQSMSNCTVDFDTDVANDSGNIVYNIPIISTNNFGNVSASLPTKFTQILPNSDTCTLDNWEIECPSSNITQNFAYNVPDVSFYVQPNISKVDKGQLKPATQIVNISSVIVGFPNPTTGLASDLNCFILDSETQVFGSSRCETVPDGNSVTCKCSFNGLISPFLSPDVSALTKYAIDRFNPDIYNEMALIPIVIFSGLTLIYVVLFRDMRKLDSLTGKFLKAKSRYIIKSIKRSIESVVCDTNFNTLKKIKKDLEAMRNKIIENLENFQTNPIEDQDFIKFLLTEERIIKHSEEAIFNIQLNEIRPIIENLENENQEFQELIATIKARKKHFASIIAIFKTDPNEAKIFKFIEENNNRATKLDRKMKKRIIEDIKNGSRNDNYGHIIAIELDQDDTEDIVLTIDSKQSLFNYDTNSYGFIIKFLEKNIKNNYKPEESYMYYFLQNSLIFGLISFTDLNFSRTARLTLLMINICLCCWITILFFGAKTYFYSDVSILNFSQVQIILYVFTLAINQAVLFAGQFLPSNYLYKEFLTEEKKYTNKLSKASFGVCWLLMVGMFISSCINAGHLPYNQQVDLILTIFISIFTTVLVLGVIKPALIAAHKTIGIKEWLLVWYKACCCKERGKARIHPVREEQDVNDASEQV